MNVCRLLVMIGIISIQVSSSNAQLSGFGDAIKKKLPLPSQPATNQQQSTPVKAETSSASDAPASPKPAVETSTLDLPPIFEAARVGDDAKFAELLKKDMSSINKTLGQVRPGEERRDKNYNIIPDAAVKFKDYTLLAFAAACGSTKIIQQLFDEDVAAESSSVLPQFSPLCLAAGNGHLDAVKMLLKAKAKPGNGTVAACENGHADVLTVLIEAGADGIQERYGDQDLLTIAVGKGHLEVVQVLLKLKIYQGNREEPIHRKAFRQALAKGNLDIVKAFVAEGEDVTDELDGAGRPRSDKTLVQIAREANQAEIVAYLKETKKAQAAAKIERDASEAQLVVQQAAKAKSEKEAKDAAASEALNNKLKDALDHPEDVYGLADSRYRKFNGKIYDCAEPIAFLNKLITFNVISDQNPEQTAVLQEAAEPFQANAWMKVANDCSLLVAFVKQVTPDGLIVRLNSQVDEEVLVLVKNHPRQDKYVDGDIIAARLFVMKISPYHYTGVLGASRTIPAYDFGVVVPTPSSPVEKLPLPDANP